jgi:cytochrome oxidase Cu insertion factor (SCO1/SenC/PrrC family)
MDSFAPLRLRKPRRARRPRQATRADARIRAVVATVDPQRDLPRNDKLWYFEERQDVGGWFGCHG